MHGDPDELLPPNNTLEAVVSVSEPVHISEMWQGISGDALRLLRDNIQFCTISTRMEEALAVSPLISEQETTDLDGLFVGWYRESAVQEKLTDRWQAEPPGVSAAQKVTRWRYKWARTLLRRPVLLWHTISNRSFGELSKHKKDSIMLCRVITRELIEDISTTWKGRIPNMMAAWGATWHLYQATMVPLLTLFSDVDDSQLV